MTSRYMKKKGRVCILSTAHRAFDDRIFHKEAKTLVRAGYDVTLIVQHDKDELVDGVRIMALPKPQNRFTRMFLLVWKAFRLALKQRADVYHFHDPELLPVGMLLKLSTRAKVVYDVHEDVPQQILTKRWIPTVFRWPLARIFDPTEKLMAQALDGVVVATEGIADKFHRVSTVVVHNYPNLTMLPDPSAVRKREDKKALIYVGGISVLRGAEEMVRALEYLGHVDGLRLDLIGRFEPASLEAELQAMQGYQRVRFIGWLQLEVVYEYLSRASIGLVCLHPEPRYSISLPVKLFEYMAAGLPVIASNFPLWKEIVEGNKCGLCVDPLDPKAIAQAIEYLIEHPKEAQQMGENGRRAVEEKYNWEIESRRFLDVYSELLGG